MYMLGYICMDENAVKKGEEMDKNKSLRHSAVRSLTIFTVCLLMLAILQRTVVFNGFIPSESMENTLMEGDRFIGNRLAYRGKREPKRYDVIVFYSPDSPETILIKRVIGLPGEKIEVKDGKVYADGKETSLSFTKEPMKKEKGETYNVPKGAYFVMGDNRNESFDSRYWEHPFVEKEKIIAKAEFKYFPKVEKID